MFNQYGLPPGNDDYSSRTKQVGVGGVDKGKTGMFAEAKRTVLVCFPPPTLRSRDLLPCK